MFNVRNAEFSDLNSISVLYYRVAKAGGGIARVAKEISEEYVTHFMANSAGSEFVIKNPKTRGIVGETHCHKIDPQIFDHVLGELTIANAPDFQGKGVGKLLFSHLLKVVEESRPDILRIELICREINVRAISLYQSLGFQIEGRMERRTRTRTDGRETDTPMAWFSKNYLFNL